MHKAEFVDVNVLLYKSATGCLYKHVGMKPNQFKQHSAVQLQLWWNTIATYSLLDVFTTRANVVGKSRFTVRLPSQITHLLLGLAHTAAAIFVFVFLGSDDYSTARVDLFAKGTLPLWLQLDATSYSQWLAQNNTLPTWTSFEEFVHDTDFHNAEITICGQDIDDADQFSQCNQTSPLYGSFCQDSLVTARTVKIIELRSNKHEFVFSGGFRMLFVLYFVASALHHCPLAIPYVYKRYVCGVTQQLRWGWRWIEYAFSASLMSIVLVLLNGQGSPEAIAQTVVITCATMLCGYAIEFCDGIRSYVHDIYVPPTNQAATYMRTDLTADEKLKQLLTFTMDKNLHLKRLFLTCGARADDNGVAFPGSPLPARMQNTSIAARSLQGLSWCLFLCAGCMQLFGLWLHPWLIRFSRTMDEMEYAHEAQFGGNLCKAGPPSYVQMALWFVVFMYLSFAVVMLWRLRHTVRDASYGACVAAASKSELQFAVLSLLSKIGLMLIFVWGVSTRSDCELLPDSIL